MIDCPNCGTSYDKDSTLCPTCKAENPLVARTDDVFRKSHAKAGSGSRGIIIGASIAGAVIVIAVFAVGFDFTTLLVSLNSSQQDTTAPNQDESEDSAASTEPVSENSVQNLLSTRVFLNPEESRTFRINIPNEEVERLEGSIKVTGGQYVSVQFLDSNGDIYCRQSSQCSYDVYVETSTKGPNNEVDIPVNGGDALTLVVTNSESSALQIADIHLFVSSGTSTDDGIGSPISEAKETEPLVVDTTQEIKSEPEDVEIQLIGTPQDYQETTTIEDYRQYALQLINEDRADAGLPPVELSDNVAAQVHAEDVLKTRHISHWMTNGEKPYMTYTRYGGTGAVGQNVAISGDMSYYKDCTSGFYYCEGMDPYSEIADHEYGMIYDDFLCCNNGHRDNILDPNHTHVSIGIAYDDYTFVLVQNFEDNYIDFTSPITTDNTNIRLIGEIPSGTEVYGINIFYDELPTTNTYQDNKSQSSYGLGEMIAGVTQPGYYYEDIITIAANKWAVNNDSIDIRFSLDSIDSEQGVYTIVTWLEDSDGNQFTATTYSVFVD